MEVRCHRYCQFTAENSGSKWMINDWIMMISACWICFWLLQEAIVSLKTSIDHLREEIAQRDSDIVNQREVSAQMIKSLESTIDSLNCQRRSLESSHAVEVEKYLASLSMRNAEVIRFVCSVLWLLCTSQKNSA